MTLNYESIKEISIKYKDLWTYSYCNIIAIILCLKMASDCITGMA